MEVRNATRINTATTTVIQTGPVRLWGVVNNKAVTNGNVTLINGTAATHEVKAQIIDPATLLQNHYSLDYHGAVFERGLTVVTTGVQDLTVIWGPMV